MGPEPMVHRPSGSPNQDAPPKPRRADFQDISARPKLLQLILLPLTGPLGQVTKSVGPWPVEGLTLSHGLRAWVEIMYCTEKTWVILIVIKPRVLGHEVIRRGTVHTYLPCGPRPFRHHSAVGSCA
jgi:hypothetical protein